MKFHTIFWPAFLLALGVPEDKLPKTMLITGFFLSDSRKMSKSIGNVIVPQDIINELNQTTDNLGNDILRYVILREMKIGNDGDITKDKIMSVYESELVNKFGNTFSRVVGMARKYNMLAQYEADNLPDQYHRAMREYDVYKAIHLLLDQITLIGQEIETTKPWELYKSGQIDELEQNIHKWLQSLTQITEAIKPIMPSTSILMQKLLNGEELHIFPRL
jgi:methionyl-tRNA synthetase